MAHVDTCKDCEYNLLRLYGIQETFNRIRRREPQTKTETIVKCRLLQYDLETVLQRIDELAEQLTQLRQKYEPNNSLLI